MDSADLQPDSEAPAVIEFYRNDSRWESVLFYGAFGGVIVSYFVSKGGWPAIIGGGFFAVLFLLAACGRAIHGPDRKLMLAFDQQGLSIPAVFSSKLPWSAITGFALEIGAETGLILYVEVTNPKLYGPKSSLALLTWPVFSRGFCLGIDPIARRETEIELAFRRFAPQVRKV